MAFSRRKRVSTVSIHAPARGATYQAHPSSAFIAFQSTPPHGGRLSGEYAGVSLEEFQSTPPHGGRLHHRRLVDATGRVSIHAPARGATSLMAYQLGVEGFQSTPPHGGRHRYSSPSNLPLLFNPRPRTGGDTEHDLAARWAPCFNPRPRTGGDIAMGIFLCGFVVSIHAPARGATRNGRYTGSDWPVSIHAPARGATS